MCNGLCLRFTKKYYGDNYYCQECALFIHGSYLHRENSSMKRLRCGCCNGLVRNKPKQFKMQNTMQIVRKVTADDLEVERWYENWKSKKDSLE